MKPIIGNRFKCCQCINFNLCYTCKFRECSDHSYLIVPYPLDKSIDFKEPLMPYPSNLLCLLKESNRNKPVETNVPSILKSGRRQTPSILIGSRDMKKKNEETTHSYLISPLINLMDNKYCTDCKEIHSSWVSLKYGCFLCEYCAQIHRSIVELNNLKNTQSTEFSDDVLNFIRNSGNRATNSKYEPDIHPLYQVPNSSSKNFVMEHYIRIKYINFWLQSTNNIPTSKEGYINKQGGKVKNWKRRFFKIDNGILSYYHNESSINPIKELHLKNIIDVEYRLETIDNHNNIIKFSSNNRTFYLSCKSELEMLDWYYVILINCDRNKEE